MSASARYARVPVGLFACAIAFAGCMSFPNGPQSLGSPGVGGPLRWSTFVTVGPQLVGKQLGGEASVLRVTFDRHLSGGAGLAAGADRRVAYAELEGVVIFTPHVEKPVVAGHEYPIWYGTGGVGPVVRWGSGRPGVQATLSSTLVFVPITLVARTQKFFDRSPVEFFGGVMLKLPVFWGAR